jgi:hypothetical protein
MGRSNSGGWWVLMKTKIDFVTNSSSTCYIVSIPKDLVVNLDIEDEESKLKALGYIEKLRDYGIIEFGSYSEDIGDLGLSSDDQDTLANSIYDQILDKKYIIEQIEFGPDIPHQIVNVNSKRIREKMERMNENKT